MTLSGSNNQCWSCDKRPTHMSPNTRIKVREHHLRTLPGTQGYVVLPPATSTPEEA